MNTLIAKELVEEKMQLLEIDNLATASIRQIVRLVKILENETGIEFVKMEMGVPGLKPAEVGVEAEIEALKSGVASIYPMIDGIPELKKELSRFVKLFLDIDVCEESCVPTVGSMQGGYASFLTLCRRDAKKNKALFIDPGFPVQKTQMQILGLDYLSFDVYDFRGDKLRDKLEEYAKEGNISTIIYSSPNNPSWICFSDAELQIIADIANKYDIVVIEDLAYFGMDFRTDYGVPGKAPYQPTVAHYTDNYILLISGSKVFSYAGQRIASLIISDTLFKRRFPDLKRYFSSEVLGTAMIYGALYSLSSGTAHSTQYALTAMLKAANDGDFPFIDSIKVYGEKAKIMKQSFVDNGFHIVYDKDEDKEVADGFYFTVAYKNMKGDELLKSLMCFGISAISLEITGSLRGEGLRACSSLIREDQLPVLEERLKNFSLKYQML